MRKNNKGNRHQRKLKTGFSLLLACMLLVGLPAAPVMATGVTNPDIIITAYDHTNKPLTGGKDFYLKDLTYKNISGEVLTNLTVDFFAAADWVIVPNGGSVIAPDEGDTLDINEENELQDLLLRFIGDGITGQIPITFNYRKEGNDTKTTAYIVLDVRAPSAPSNPTPTDTSKYKPSLAVSVVGSNFVDGGRQTQLKLLVKNTDTSYTARKVSLSLQEDKEHPVFPVISFGGQLPVLDLQPGKSVEVTMTVTTDRLAKAGTSPLPLSMTWENSWQDRFSSNFNLSLTVRNALIPGQLVVEVGAPSKEIVPGEVFTLPVTVRNLGVLPVYQIQVTLDGLSQDGFTLSSGSSRLSWDRITAAGKQTAQLQLLAGSGLKTGSHPIRFALGYVDERETLTEDVQEIWLPVTGLDASGSVMDVTSIKTSRSSVKPGDVVSLSVTVKNNGATTARQVRVSGEVAGDMFFPTTQNLHILQAVEPGESKTLSFTYQAQADAARGSTPLTVKVEVPGDETPVPLIQAVSVFVEGSATAEDASKNVPKVIVYSYAAEPALVTAGDEFNLNLSFMNTHSTKSIRNIKANFTVTEASSESGSVFTPVGSSNTFYIDRIGPGTTVDRTLRLYTVPDAKSKTYNVSISFEYEDLEGNPFQATEIIGIPVYQPARFEISELSYMPDTMVGQMMPLSFEMYNLGKNTLYNVKLRVVSEQEGMLDFQPKSQYYGNMEAGQYEYSDIMITPMMPGAVSGYVEIVYESSSGEAETLIKDFTLNVMEMPPFEMPGEIIGPDGRPIPIGPDGMPIYEEEPQKGFFGRVFGNPWVLGGIGLLAVAAAVVVIRKLRNRKVEKGLEF